MSLIGKTARQHLVYFFSQEISQAHLCDVLPIASWPDAKEAG